MLGSWRVLTEMGILGVAPRCFQSVRPGAETWFTHEKMNHWSRCSVSSITAKKFPAQGLHYLIGPLICIDDTSGSRIRKFLKNHVGTTGYITTQRRGGMREGKSEGRQRVRGLIKPIKWFKSCCFTDTFSVCKLLYRNEQKLPTGVQVSLPVLTNDFVKMGSRFGFGW